MSLQLQSCSIYYNDINLIAQPQENYQSRKLIPRDLDQIIVSPMSSVIGEKFAIEALKLGLTICLHRFCPVDEQINLLKKLYDEFGKEEIQEGWKSVYVSVGLNDNNRVEKLEKIGHKEILLDCANGYLSSVINTTKNLQELGFSLMSGNVHSSKGFNLYNNCKVRVGIGNGHACKTGDVTSYTRGQVTEILECYNNRYSKGQKIIADGGVKGSREAAIAFGLGSDFVMMGSYFSHAEEAQNIIDGEYKYWGGASHHQQIKQHGEIRRHSEGKELDLDKNNIKPLKVLVDDLWGGISSAISYSGKSNLSQFIGNCVWELKK